MTWMPASRTVRGRISRATSRSAYSSCAPTQVSSSSFPSPPATRGYNDLRRAATREPIGKGLRPSVASIGDLARMAAALGREQDVEPLRQLRYLRELERSLVRGIER